MGNKAALITLLAGILLILVPAGIARAFSGAGSGTQQNPYIITNIYELQEMNDDLDAWYELGNDIDASDTKNWNAGEGFLPIGDGDNKFVGHLDGKGFVIKDLFIRRPSSVALLGSIGTIGEVKNLGIVNGDIKADTTGPARAAGLAAVNSGTITNCYYEGTVIGAREGGGTSLYTGGLVAFNAGGITNCYSAGTVSAEVEDCVGGLVGSNHGELNSCYSTASVTGGDEHVGGLVSENSGNIVSCYSTGSVDGHLYTGGLVGIHYDGSIINCYSTGTVVGDEKVGGLVGLLTGYGSSYGTITNCYSIGHISGNSDVGGLVGYDAGGICNDCFWDMETSGQTTSACGTGKTTAEMKQKATFANWDFENVWGIVENATYPYLRETPNPAMPIKGVDVSSHQGDIDWSQVYKAGYRFAFVKASEGEGWKDSCFDNNIKGAHDANILAGAYHFGLPQFNDPYTEAEWFLKVASPYLRSGYLRPAFDLEDHKHTHTSPRELNEQNLTKWILEWMYIVEMHTGAKPILYTNRSYTTYLDPTVEFLGRKITDYKLWIADPECGETTEPTTTGIWNTWVFWQYWDPQPPPNGCGENYVPGISGGVDLDLFNGDDSMLKTFMLSAKKPDLIFFYLCSPADMIVTDPQGLIVSKNLNQIAGAIYGEIDIDGDGDLEDKISIPRRKMGEYLIDVIPESNALPEDTYSLEVTIDGQTMVLAEDVQIQDIPTEPYIFESKLNRCDFDADGDVDFVDLAELRNHWVNTDCNYPGWCEGTDLDYSGRVNLVDFAVFANNWLWEKIPADFDMDGDVDLLDFSVLAGQWLQAPGEPSADIAPEIPDGVVDILDLAVLADYWLEGL